LHRQEKQYNMDYCLAKLYSSLKQQSSLSSDAVNILVTEFKTLTH